ncbi:unnamed protein product [Rotaria sordida]|uniref:Claudin n=1 Tax=Rotaria sordida TaxID=392033 RepID=A0A815PWD1_9BILA|nr:unnamed protein product [Rotaria sordida]CAF3950072.1 unnamed protein product [Rotaria sordida]
MSSNIRLLSIVAGIMLGLSSACFIVSNAVPEWGKYKITGIESTIGLWQYCAFVSNVKTCQSISSELESFDADTYHKIQAAEAFVTLACIMSGISTCCLLACALMGDNVHQILLWTSKGLAFSSFIMGTVGIALGIYAIFNNRLTNQLFTQLTITLGAASCIGIAAIVINLVGAIIAVFMRK